MQFPEGGKMRISPKLEVCGKNEYDIRNQRAKLRRNRLFLGRKAGGGVSAAAPNKLHVNVRGF